jgi:hypothetical protein
MTALVLPTDAPAVPGPPQGQWTYADWEELPDDGNRYEIIDGVLYMTTAPSSFHQWIVNRYVYGEAEVASFDCLPTISVPVGGLFAGAPDTTL